MRNAIRYVLISILVVGAFGCSADAITDVQPVGAFVIPAGFAFASKGREIDYDPETRLNFTLTNPVRM